MYRDGGFLIIPQSAAILECLAGDTVILPNIGTDSSSIYVADDLGELEEGGGTIMGINVLGEAVVLMQKYPKI